MARRIDFTLERMPWLVYDYGGEVLGYVYASRHRERGAYRWSVDVTAYVDPRMHRSGIGRALYTSLFALLNLQGYCRAYAGITLPNQASVGLHEALGFTPVGVYRSVGHSAPGTTSAGEARAACCEAARGADP
jgi:phosphinothricin acetyltransferase